MCDPVSIGSAVLLGAGTVANMQSQRQQSKARERALAANAERQDALSREAQGVFDQSLEQASVDKQQVNMDAAAQERMADYDAYEAQAPQSFDPTVPGADRAPRIVQTEAARNVARGAQEARSQLAAKALLDAFGDRGFDRRVQLQRGNEQMGMIGAFSRGNNGVARAELSAAENAGSGTAMLGDALTGIGSVGMSAGGGGDWFGGGGGATGPRASYYNKAAMRTSVPGGMGGH